MRTHPLPLSDIGGTGIFALLAERLASRPNAAGAGKERIAKVAAPAPVTAGSWPGVDATAISNGAAYARFRDLDPESRRAMVMCGLWMRAGVVGAAVTAAGLVQLFGGTGPLLGIALIVGGAALAAFGWRRAWLAVARADDAACATATPAQSAPALPVAARTVE